MHDFESSMAVTLGESNLQTPFTAYCYYLESIGWAYMVYIDMQPKPGRYIEAESGGGADYGTAIPPNIRS
jgi:hypothetical protein